MRRGGGGPGGVPGVAAGRVCYSGVVSPEEEEGGLAAALRSVLHGRLRHGRLDLI